MCMEIYKAKITRSRATYGEGHEASQLCSKEKDSACAILADVRHLSRGHRPDTNAAAKAPPCRNTKVLRKAEFLRKKRFTETTRMPVAEQSNVRLTTLDRHVRIEISTFSLCNLFRPFNSFKYPISSATLSTGYAHTQ